MDSGQCPLDTAVAHNGSLIHNIDSLSLAAPCFPKVWYQRQKTQISEQTPDNLSRVLGSALKFVATITYSAEIRILFITLNLLVIKWAVLGWRRGSMPSKRQCQTLHTGCFFNWEPPKITSMGKSIWTRTPLKVWKKVYVSKLGPQGVLTHHRSSGTLSLWNQIPWVMNLCTNLSKACLVFGAGALTKCHVLTPEGILCTRNNCCSMVCSHTMAVCCTLKTNMFLFVLYFNFFSTHGNFRGVPVHT